MLNLIVMGSAQRRGSMGRLVDIAKTPELARIADRVTIEQPNGDMVIRKDRGPGGPFFDVELNPGKGVYFRTIMGALSRDDLLKLAEMDRAWSNAPEEW